MYEIFITNIIQVNVKTRLQNWSEICGPSMCVVIWRWNKRDVFSFSPPVANALNFVTSQMFIIESDGRCPVWVWSTWQPCLFCSNGNVLHTWHYNRLVMNTRYWVPLVAINNGPAGALQNVIKTCKSGRSWLMLETAPWQRGSLMWFMMYLLVRESVCLPVCEESIMPGVIKRPALRSMFLGQCDFWCGRPQRPDKHC